MLFRSRYNTDGALDTRFDGDGVFTGYIDNGTSAFNALALAPNGDLIAGGKNFSGVSQDFAVMRFGALAGTLQASAGSAFSYTVPADAFYAPDGSPLTLSASLAGGGALPSWLVFNPATRTFSGTPGAGDFATLPIQVTATDAAGATSASLQLDVTSTMIQSLLAVGEPRWNADATRGTGVAVTYSFMTAAPAYAQPDEKSTFEAFNQAQKNATSEVLGRYASIINVTFSEVSDAGDGGLLRFGRNTQGPATSGYASYPRSSPEGGDVWIDKTDSTNDAPVAGDFGYETLVHEVGHALGLPPEILASLAPKSVTAPVAMGIAERLHGIPALAAVAVLLTGLTGALSGRYLFDWLGVRAPEWRGFALGTAAHGIGAARAMQVHPDAGAYAGLALGLQALLAALLLPLLAGWFS